MASRAPYELHHHFPKLAEESGFTFNVHRPRAHVDWHKIRSIDIESIIKERKFYIIEQHLTDIFNCVLESEFDVRILDEGVLKLFRLAQLAVEYQQFCRHYLDRSVYVLREEITSLAQELDSTRKNLHEREEELKKIKKRNKHTCRTPLPFGNDNIATMILKTLSNKSEIFGNPSTSNADSMQYNKCSYCDKVFLNQLYLKSHINRRHSNMLDVPQRDGPENVQNTTQEKETSKMNDEIGELKNKLKEMESLLVKVNNERSTPIPPEVKATENPTIDKQAKPAMKDAEVSTSSEANLIDKIEEWKKEEHEKYNKEINLLRTQIVDIVNTFKNREAEKPVQTDTNLIEQLHSTIKQQGTEIHVLKQELISTESLTNKANDKVDNPRPQTSSPHLITNGDVKRKHGKRKIIKSKPEADAKTLETLHRKAQELLNIRSISSSDISSSIAQINRDKLKQNTVEKVSKHQIHKDIKEEMESKQAKFKKEKTKSTNNSHKIGNGVITAPGSPMKLVRAKITEEVNSRLVNIGVDPLKNRLPKSYFKKQKLQLQQQCEAKSKKTPEYQKIKHSILAYLDSSTPATKKERNDVQDYISPTKISKAFSLTSVISNVKNKALSFVKSNETNVNAKRREVNAEVAKKAMDLLKTPPSSGPSSPIQQKKVDVKSRSAAEEVRPVPRKRVITTPQKSVERENILSAKKKLDINYADDDESSESDHKYYNSAIVSQSSKSIENLIKSPARRPSSASAVDYNGTIRKLVAESVEHNLLRSQSAANILEHSEDTKANNKLNTAINYGNSSDDVGSLEHSPLKNAKSDENIPKQTKGVLKNASSTSSLNKKKVLFDMDAIQMKSVSASPSQSITEKSDNDKFELGLVNLDGEEWDISSIENEPLKEDTKIQVNTRTSPKIAELKQAIESQLARRNDTASTALAGGVDLMPAPMIRNSSIAGSNTSLGSSILDESYGIPTVNHKAFIKSKKVAEKDDSEFDLSDSIDGLMNKKGNDSF
ncbi:zinc finger protein DZIP1L [Phthorimaea operculella]|nr:zinc finger protein DZIP1L [Phthorimaea operculella]